MEIAKVRNQNLRQKVGTMRRRVKHPSQSDRSTCAGAIQTTALPLQHLQKIVELVDRQSFFIRERRYEDLTAHDVLRHDLFHLAKAVSKVAAWFEADDHYVSGELQPILQEVIPDLIIYATQIANKFELSLDNLMRQRLYFTLTKYSE